MFMYGPGRYRGVLDPATDRLRPLGGVNSCALPWVDESRPRRRPWVVSGGLNSHPVCAFLADPVLADPKRSIGRGGWRVSRTASAHVATAAPPADAETPASEAAGEPESHGARRHGADSVEDDSSGPPEGV